MQLKTLIKKIYYIYKNTYLINTLLIFVITGIRPLLGPSDCIYAMSCTTYAYTILRIYPLWRALPKIIGRVLTCYPGCPQKWRNYYEIL